MDDYLFYDVEVFQYDALIVFKDIDNNEVAHYWNNRDRLGAEHPTDCPSGFEEIPELIRGKTLVGYNNYHYDDYILTAMMNPVMSTVDVLKMINDSIIKGGEAGISIDKNIQSLDTMQQLLMRPSLKQIEGNMGRSIIESSVPFDIDRPLTDEEREETLHYCRYDVESTIQVFKLRDKEYFQTKSALADMIDPEMNGLCRWNTTTMSARILLGRSKMHLEPSHRVPKEWWRNPESAIPEEVWQMWEKMVEDEDPLAKGVSTTIKAFGCDVVFGMGGLHGAPTEPGYYRNVKLADVGSMYPSIIVKLNILGNATETYDGLRQERLKIKHVDKVRADALKLVLNSVYGNLKNQYSALYNPWLSATVCIFGQIALYTLCHRLDGAGYRVININTDGVAFEDNKALDGRYEQICREWEQDFSGLLLEVDEFEHWIQKDVNNYIAVHDGKIKTKGGEVNKAFSDKYFANNDCRIAQLAMVEYLVYGTPIYDTLIDYVDYPRLWQYILKAGHTYKGVVDGQGNIQNKVNRVFAVRKNTPGITKLYKLREDDGLVNFPDVPDNMLICNGETEDIPDFADIIDMSFYKKLVDKKLKGWPKIHGIC